MSGVPLRWGALIMLLAALLLIAAVAFGHVRTILQLVDSSQPTAEKHEAYSFAATSELFEDELQILTNDVTRIRAFLIQTAAANSGGLTAAFLASRRNQLFAAFWSVYQAHDAEDLVSVAAASLDLGGSAPTLLAAFQLGAPTPATPSVRWLQTPGSALPVSVTAPATQISLDQYAVRQLNSSKIALLLPNQTLGVPWAQLVLPFPAQATTVLWTVSRGAFASVSVSGQTSPSQKFSVTAQLNIGAVFREALEAAHGMDTAGSGSWLLLLNETTLSVIAGAELPSDLSNYPCDALDGDAASCAEMLASMEAAFVPDWWKSSVLQPALQSGSVATVGAGTLPTQHLTCGVDGRACMSLALPLPRSVGRVVLLWITSPPTTGTIDRTLAARVTIGGIVLLVACVASGYWAAGWLQIFRPMGPLTESMADVQTLNFDCLLTSEETLQQQTTAEMRELHDSFFHMVGNIKAFSQYVSKPVLLDLMQCGKVDAREMESKELTIVLIDIAGFTTMCEALTTEQLVEVAETYFDAASRTLVLHGCTLDKYIGDAIMGFWGAPLPYERQAYSSCAAALHLLTVVHRLQPLFRDNGVELSVRVGLHCGAALVGNIGCSQRVAYTAIGSNVTLASQLEEESKRQKTSILVSEAVASAAEADSPDLFVFRCVGKVSDIVAYELVGLARSAVADVVRLSKDNAVSEISTGTKATTYGTSSAPQGFLLGEGSEKDRVRRRQSVSTDQNGASLTASQRRTEQFASNEAAPSASSGVSRARTRTRPARLNEYEEVLLIQHTFHVSKEHALVIQTLSNAVHSATVSGELLSALPELNSILEHHKEVLVEHSINIPVLQRLAQQWARQLQSEAHPMSPSRSQAFGGSPQTTAFSP